MQVKQFATLMSLEQTPQQLHMDCWGLKKLFSTAIRRWGVPIGCRKDRVLHYHVLFGAFQPVQRYVCMYVCMYVCIYIYIYVYIEGLEIGLHACAYSSVHTCATVENQYTELRTHTRTDM